MRIVLIPTAAAVLLVTGCVSATYEERMGYLRRVAAQGAETHQLLRDQEAPVVDKDRCARAWDGLDRSEDVPDDQPAADGITPAWRGQIKEFFVDSCVSGKPKPVPGDPVPSTSDSPIPAPSSVQVLGPAAPVS